MRALFGPTVVFVLGGPGAGKGARGRVGSGPFLIGVALGDFFLNCNWLALYILVNVYN